jgi:hypothetical protein
VHRTNQNGQSSVASSISQALDIELFPDIHAASVQPGRLTAMQDKLPGTCFDLFDDIDIRSALRPIGAQVLAGCVYSSRIASTRVHVMGDLQFMADVLLW